MAGRKRPKPSRGGRTPSEAGFAASQAASGKKVSSTNLNVAKGYKVPKGVKQVTSGSGYTTTGSGTNSVVSKKKRTRPIGPQGKPGSSTDPALLPNAVTGLSVEAQEAGIKGTRKTRKEKKRGERRTPLERLDRKIDRKNDRANRLIADYIATGDKAAKRRGNQIRQQATRLEEIKRPRVLNKQRMNRKINKAVQGFKEDEDWWKKNGKGLQQQLKTQQGRKDFFADIVANDATNLSKTDSNLPITNKTKALNRPNQILENLDDVQTKQKRLERRIKRLDEQGKYGKVRNLIAKYDRVAKRNIVLSNRYRKAKDKQVRIALNFVDNQKSGGTARLPSEKQALIDNKNKPGLIEEAAKGLISFDSFKRIVGDQKERIERVIEGDSPMTLLELPNKEKLDKAKAALEDNEYEIGGLKVPRPPGEALAQALLELGKPEGEASLGDYVAAGATAIAAAKLARYGGNIGKAVIGARKQAQQGIDPDVLLGIKPASEATKNITAKKILFDQTKRNVAGSKAAERTISAVQKIRKVTDNPDFQFVRKAVVRVGGGTAAFLWRDYTLPAIGGTVKGFVEDPLQTLETTARGIISGVTSPLALLANGLITGSRAITGIGAEGYRGDSDYITHPVRELATQYWEEIKNMGDVYLSKDVDRIAKATQEDYGLLNAMGAYWILRPYGKGLISTPAKKIGTLITYKGTDLTKIYNRWTADMASKAKLTVLTARLESAQQRVMRDLTKSLDKNLMDFNKEFKSRFGRDHEVVRRYNNIIAGMAEDRDIIEKGDMTARQFLDESMIMSDKERAQILKEQFNAPTFADLAVYLQTTRTPLLNATEFLRKRRDSLDGTAEELVNLRILLELPELLDTTTDIGKAFTEMRVNLLQADLKSLANDEMGYRDVDPESGKYSDPVDVETIINIEQQLKPEDRPQMVDDDGNPINIPYSDPERVGQIRRPEQLETDVRVRDQGELNEERKVIRRLQKELAAEKKKATKLKNKWDRLEGEDAKARKAANKTDAEVKNEEAAKKRIKELETDIQFAILRHDAKLAQLARVRQFNKDIKALKSAPEVKTKAPANRVTGDDRKAPIRYRSDEGYTVTKRKDGWVVRNPKGKELGVAETKGAADSLATKHLRETNVAAQRTKGNKEGTYVYGDKIPEGTIYKTERRGNGWVALGRYNKVLARGKTRTEVEAVLEPLLREDQLKALREDRRAYKDEQRQLESQLKAARSQLKTQQAKLDQIIKGWEARGYKRDPKLDETAAAYEKQLELNASLAMAIDMSDAAARRMSAKLSGILTPEERKIVLERAKIIAGDNGPVDARALTPEEARKRTEEMTLARAATFGEMDTLVDRRLELEDDTSPDAAEERGEIETRLEELRMEVAIQTALIEDADLMLASHADAATIRAALQIQTAEKRRANYAEEMAVITRSFQRLIDEYTDQYKITQGMFIPHNPAPDPGRNSASPRYGPTISVKKERFRTGDQARTGNIDRSYAAWYEALQYQLKAASYRRITEHLLAEDAIRFDLGFGEQVVFAKDDRARLEKEGVFMGRPGQPGAVAEFPYRALADPMMLQRVVKTMKVDGNDYAGAFEDAFQRIAREDAKDEVSNMGLDPTTDEFRRQVELRAQQINREGRGEGVVFIREAAIQRLFDQEKTFDSAFWKTVEAVNKAASKLVLGTSVSWALAQPVAEFLVLAAENPRAAALIGKELTRISRRRAALVNDPEGLRLLSFFSDSVLGNDTITRRQQGGQKTARDAVVEMRDQTYVGLQLKELAKLNTLGNIDRAKGAWIREVGMLAALDRELSFMTRASKAVKGQMDEIEKVADKLTRMTSDAERLRFLYSPEGRKAGERLIGLIDDAMGNWTKLSPGERPIANLVFFYPFVRFSIRYVLYTFPKAHPIRWQLAAMFGLANAELLEKYLDEAPAFMSGWAAIPIFGDNDETPSHILALNRIAPGGNALVEMMGNFQSPFDFTKLLTPPLGAAARFVSGRDEWGNPVGSGTGGLFDTTPSIGNLVKEGVDTFTDLSPVSREIKRHFGISFDGPISDPRFKILTGEEARPKRPGDDSGGAIGFLRRQFFPYLIPRDIDAVKKEYKVSALWERYGELADIESREYSDLAKRGIALYDKQKDIVDAHGETYSPEYFADLAEFQAFQRTNRAYRQYLREKGEKDQAEDMMRPIARAITKVYKGSNAPLESSKQFKDLATTEEQHRKDIREEWTSKRPGRVYPGYEQAKRDVKEWKGDPVVRKASGSDDPAVSVAKPEKLVDIRAGSATTNRLRKSTADYLRKQGNVRKADLTNPLADPRTKVRKNGTVARYRGEKVMGNIKLSELRAAESSNSLTTEKNSGMLMTPEVRQVYTHAVKQNELVRQLSRKQAQLAEDAGGVPSGVPEKYKGLIKKWGAYLEREMTKNGLVGVDGGLPEGMTGAEYLAKIIQAESNWDERIGHPDNTSSAQAQGLGQFIPSTRDAFLQQFGVDAYGGAEEQIKAAAFHLDGNHTSGGLNSYNPGFPADSDGTWGYYLDQNVGKVVPTNKAALKQLKIANQNLKQAKDKADSLYKKAKKQGIPVPRPQDGALNEVVGPSKAKGPYAGARRIVSQMIGQPVLGDKEPGHSAGGYHDPAVGNAYAQDIQLGSSNAAEGEPVYTQELLDKITKRIRDMGGQIPDLVMGMGYTTGYLKGYELEIIPDSQSNYHGSGPHLHIGAKWTGAQPPPGTVFGSGSGAVASSGGGGSYATGGGSSLPQVSGKSNKMSAQDLMSLPLGSGGEDPQDLPSVIDSMSQSKGDSVESVTEQLANLPVPKKKKPPIRFNPANRI